MRTKTLKSYTLEGNHRHKFVSSCGKYTYHMAIIDYLQVYNFEKQSESFFKTWVLRRSANLISAVDPVLYATRFVHFISHEVLLDSNLSGENECCPDKFLKEMQ